MILLKGYVYHDKIVQVSTERLRNHNPALSYLDFAEICARNLGSVPGQAL